MIDYSCLTNFDPKKYRDDLLEIYKTIHPYLKNNHFLPDATAKTMAMYILRKMYYRTKDKNFILNEYKYVVGDFIFYYNKNFNKYITSYGNNTKNCMLFANQYIKQKNARN